MQHLHLAAERGHANHGWLQTHYSFSFADYYNPDKMGVSVLRVINDDRIMPGTGFGAHPHRDMEIITYMLEGEIEHRDSMGNRTRLKAGEVQVMSAGSGVTHSEHNPSQTTPLELLQIWIQPDRRNYRPRYAQQDFSANQGLNLIVASDAEASAAALPIRQDVRVYQLRLAQGTLSLPLQPQRLYYLHIARGELQVQGHQLQHGDALELQQPTPLEVSTRKGVDALLFELPVLRA
ncbi:MAG TPA: pirin family protein [Motiliproteus sp.]